MTEDEHDYIWLEDICCGSSLLRLPRTAHMPVLHFPLAESFRPLKDLMTLMKSLVGCNFIPALGMLAGVVMGMGYAQIVNHYQFCPTVIATGGLSCGKTTSLISALSTIGCHKSGI